MSARDRAEELVEVVCKALGTSLRHYEQVTKQAAISEAEYWLRDNATDEFGNDYA